MADWEDFANAERVRDVHVRRVNSKTVDLKPYDGKPRFPFAEGVLSQPMSNVNSTRQRNRSWEPPTYKLPDSDEVFEADDEAEIKPAGRPINDTDDDYIECVEPSDDILESGEGR